MQRFGKPAGVVAIVAALFVAIDCAQASKTITDYENYFSGSWTAFVAPYARGKLVIGNDYTESITVVPDRFPDASTLVWDWKSNVAPGVYDFSSLQYGNYLGTFPPQPIPSRALSSIKRLTVTYNISLSGDLEGYDVIIDLFLTAKPGDSQSLRYELEVFLHTPKFASAYAKSVKQVGTMEICGRVWNISINPSVTGSGQVWQDILITPADGRDTLTATMDLKEVVQRLIVIKLVPNNLYFNGLGFGKETHQGKGSMTINGLSVIYQ